MRIPDQLIEIDPWLRHVEYLRQSLLTSTDERQPHLYLLIDTRARPDLHKRWVDGRIWRYVSLWEQLSTSAYPDIAPYLIAIEPGMLDRTDSHHALLEQLWSDTANGPMLTWVASPFSLEALAQHFQRFCTFRNQAARLFFLHFYDNRVLTRLHQGFEPALWQAFIAPCYALGSRDRRNQPVLWRNPQPPAYAAEVTPLVFSDAQNKRLLAVGYPDKLAAQLRRTCDVDEDEASDADWTERIESQLARATAYGVAGEQNLARYAILGALVSPTFDEHPAVQPVLRRLADGEESSAVLDAVEQAVEQHVEELTRGAGGL